MNKSPNEVDAEIPSARFRGLFLRLARGFGHPAYLTIRILWDMHIHFVISVWFGIVGSVCHPSTLSNMASAA